MNIKNHSAIILRIWKKFKRFRKNPNSNLNIFLVCTAVILVWKGLWDLADIYIFPNYPTLGAIVCIIIGILILLIDDGKIDEL